MAACADFETDLALLVALSDHTVLQAEAAANATLKVAKESVVRVFHKIGGALMRHRDILIYRSSREDEGLAGRARAKKAADALKCFEDVKEFDEALDQLRYDTLAWLPSKPKGRRHT